MIIRTNVKVKRSRTMVLLLLTMLTDVNRR